MFKNVERHQNQIDNLFSLDFFSSFLIPLSLWYNYLFIHIFSLSFLNILCFMVYFYFSFSTRKKKSIKKEDERKRNRRISSNIYFWSEQFFFCSFASYGFSDLPFDLCVSVYGCLTMCVCCAIRRIKRTKQITNRGKKGTKRNTRYI